jgi:hypothetical protein
VSIIKEHDMLVVAHMLKPINVLKRLLSRAVFLWPFAKSNRKLSKVSTRLVICGQGLSPLRHVHGTASEHHLPRLIGALVMLAVVLAPALHSFGTFSFLVQNNEDIVEGYEPLVLVARRDEATLPRQNIQSFALAYAAAQHRGAVRVLSPEVASNTTASVVGSGGTRPSHYALKPQSWVEHVMASVNVRDGQTLEQGDVMLRLAGVTLPSSDQMCKLLNGQQESCAQRMATQLELLTRHRQVTCRHRALAPHEVLGGVIPEATCRIGDMDLASRLEAGTWKVLAEKPVAPSPHQHVDTQLDSNAQSLAPLQNLEPANMSPVPLPPVRPVFTRAQTAMLQ